MLPVMREEEASDHYHGCWSGQYHDPCANCNLYGHECTGCGNRREDCVQRVCRRECFDCGGGSPLQYTGANIPSVCCKSPYRELYLQQVKKDKFHFTKRPLIKLRSRAIIINQGSPGQYRATESPYPKEAEALAVNLRHVWSTRGWFSHDMKDYLHVPRKMKLILLTATHDDVLHRAWNAELYDTDFASLGFDYWQALEFSQYADYSKYHSVWEGYRVLRAIEVSKAHFATFPGKLDLGKQRREYRLYEKCVEAIPQITVNLQLSSSVNEFQFRIATAVLKRFVDRIPVKAIWFIGIVSANAIYNLQRNLPDQRCYFLSVNPWLAAHKGDEFSKVGKLKKSDIPRLDLLLQNQRNYANLVNDAVDAALSSVKQKIETNE